MGVNIHFRFTNTNICDIKFYMILYNLLIISNKTGKIWSCIFIHLWLHTEMFRFKNIHLYLNFQLYNRKI